MGVMCVVTNCILCLEISDSQCVPGFAYWNLVRASGPLSFIRTLTALNVRRSGVKPHVGGRDQQIPAMSGSNVETVCRCCRK